MLQLNKNRIKKKWNKKNFEEDLKEIFHQEPRYQKNILFDPLTSDTLGSYRLQNKLG